MFGHFCVLVVSLALLAVQAARDAPQTYKLVEIKYADLVTLDENASHDLTNALTQIGAVQITGIPRFDAIRKRALEDLADCHISEGTAPTLTMPDGSRRMSCGAASHRGVGEPMSHFCGEAAAKLRAAVDAATRQLFLALDAVVAKRQPSSKLPLMKPHYDTFSALMAEGEHLEHLHTYFAPEKVSQESQEEEEQGKGDAKPSAATLRFHVDQGLMIAMTAGFYSSPPSPEAGLYMELPDGSRPLVQTDENALIILMGDGGARWLEPVLGVPFRAPMHGMFAGLAPGSGASRAWYGKMYLPPADALILDTGLEFSAFHALQSSHSALASTASGADLAVTVLPDLLPSACGGQLAHPYGRRGTEQKGRFLSAVAGDDCGTDAIWCWAQCMSVADKPCGTDAICWNMDDNVPWTGGMCMRADKTNFCEPMCISPNAQNESYDPYCIGQGTSMFMSGFESIVQDDQTECVNLLFSEWTLNSKGKFAAGCLGTFFMCLLIQGLSFLRGKLNSFVKEDSWMRKGAHVLLYGCHVTLGYFAMLIAMTYSVELFCMVCAGLTAGFALFHLQSPHEAKSTDPCCGELPGDEEQAELYKPLTEDDSAKRRASAPVVGTASAVAEEYSCCSGH